MEVSISASPGTVQATVYVMEQLGREILLNTKVGEEMVRAIAASDAQLEPGQPVWLKFDEASIHVFDRETEESLLAQDLGGD
jgi:multiple sugar transport system ATP-binding protein